MNDTELIDNLLEAMEAYKVDLETDYDHGSQNKIADENRIEMMRKIKAWIVTARAGAVPLPLYTI